MSSRHLSWGRCAATRGWFARKGDRSTSLGCAVAALSLTIFPITFIDCDSDREVSNSLENHGNALADTDAHGAKSVPSFRSLQLIDCCRDQPGSAGTKGMT